jgi:hypothetical protein
VARRHARLGCAFPLLIPVRMVLTFKDQRFPKPEPFCPSSITILLGTVHHTEDDSGCERLTPKAGGILPFAAWCTVISSSPHLKKRSAALATNW